MANIIIAVCALVISVWSIYFTIRHHKLSVTPHLVTHQHTEFRDDGIVLSFEVSNHGIGPAKIEKFEIFLEGKPFAAKSEPVEAVLKSSFVNLPHRILFQAHLKNYCLKAGQSYPLARVLLPGMKEFDKESITKKAKRIDFRIEYASFYKNRYVLDTRTTRKPEELVQS
jgi:hypothetical protein